MKETPIDQWTRMNRKMRLYEILCAGIVLGHLGLVAGIWFALTRPTILVRDDINERKYFVINNEDLPPTKSDVEAILKDFVQRRYTYSKETFNDVFTAIGPLCTDGYLEEADKAMNKEEKEFGMVKMIEVLPVNIKTVVTDKEAKAKFEKFIRLDGVPLVLSTEILLSLVPADRTKDNPYGLSIDGVVEHENR